MSPKDCCNSVYVASYKGPTVKRKLCVLLLLFLFSCALLFGDNLQKIFGLDDEVYDLVERLFISCGLALPSSARPWSADEIARLLELLEGKKLNKEEAELFQRIQDKAKPPRSVFKADLFLSPEGYFHFDTANFNKSEDWAYGYEKRKPFLNLSSDFSLLDNFYGLIDVCLCQCKYFRPFESSWFGAHKVDSNFRFFYSFSDVGVDNNMPYRAFGAAGGKGWSLEVGRDRISWGPGKIGNLVLGEHVQYHNLARFTVYSKPVKYTFVTSFFPHPYEVYPEDAEGNPLDVAGLGQYNPVKKLKMFIGHRLEARFFSNRLGIAITENIMYQPLESVFADLRVLNPMMIFHNYDNPLDANSIASLELDFSLPRWNFFFQYALDEVALPTERTDVDWVHPNASGYMVGIRASYPVPEGWISCVFEGALTDPYLYLRAIDKPTGKLRDNMNFIVHLRKWGSTIENTSFLVYDPSFLGFKYGEDAIVADFFLTYFYKFDFSLTFGVFYMIHGIHGINTAWETGPKAFKTRTPAGGWDKASKTLDLRLGAEYKIQDRLSLNAQFDYIRIKNLGHIPGKNAFDFQFVLGMTAKVF